MLYRQMLLLVFLRFTGSGKYIATNILRFAGSGNYIATNKFIILCHITIFLKHNNSSWKYFQYFVGKNWFAPCKAANKNIGINILR